MPSRGPVFMSLVLLWVLSGCAHADGANAKQEDEMSREVVVVDLFAVKADIKKWELMLAELAPFEYVDGVTQGPEMALLSCTERTYRLTGATGVAIQREFDVEDYFRAVETEFRSDEEVRTYREKSRWGGERLIVSRKDGAEFSISHFPDSGQMHVASDSACYLIDADQAPFGIV